MKEVLDLWKTAADLHNKLWAFYVTVGSAILGFSFLATFGRTSELARVTLFVLLLAFVVTNAVSIWENLLVYNAATLALQEGGQENGPLAKVAMSIRTIPVRRLLLLHALCDLCALAVLAWNSITS